MKNMPFANCASKSPSPMYIKTNYFTYCIVEFIICIEIERIVQMELNDKKGINSKIFWSMLRISATTFGGGFVIVPLLKNKFVDEEGLLEENEMLDLMAIAQSCPGPIAVNASVMVGYRISGIKGALTALLATIIPPLVIISVISLFYSAFRNNKLIHTLMSGMLCGVTAVIIDVVIQMTKKLDGKLVSYLVLIIAFVMACILKINVIAIIGVAAVAGLVAKGVKRK